MFVLRMSTMPNMEPPALDGRDAIRHAIERQIETLLAALDHMDGDADDEPSLGWTRTMAWGTTDDREEPNTSSFDGPILASSMAAMRDDR